MNNALICRYLLVLELHRSIETIIHSIEKLNKRLKYDKSKSLKKYDKSKS